MTLNAKAAHRKDIRTGKSDMQHRHFATVAAIIRTLPRLYGGAEWAHEQIVNHFADELASTNPNFNRERFIAACLHQEAE